MVSFQEMSISNERRSEIGRMGAAARWDKTHPTASNQNGKPSGYRYRLVCAICGEHLGSIAYAETTCSIRGYRTHLDHGVFGFSKKTSRFAHVLGHEVHHGELIEGTELVIGEKHVGTWEELMNPPIDKLAYHGTDPGVTGIFPQR